MSWQLKQLRAHAKRFEGFSIGLQPIDARAIIADIDAAVDAMSEAVIVLEGQGITNSALHRALKRFTD